MYFAELGYLTGFTSFTLGMIIFVVVLLVGATGFVIKRLRELNLMTIPEYFEFRYGRDVRVLAGVLMALGGSLNLGIFPVVEAKGHDVESSDFLEHKGQYDRIVMNPPFDRSGSDIDHVMKAYNCLRPGGRRVTIRFK
jgi:hypothetical protein